MTEWLDTETKALLERIPPGKLAPPDTAGFTLVLLAAGGDDRDALAAAVQRAAGVSAEEADRILGRPLPTAVAKGLVYADAQIGQFELICCDAVSAIIADEVVAEAPAEYLADLYARLRRSEEFENVWVRIDRIPSDRAGYEFCGRFLNGQQPAVPATVALMRKKARIMAHWASRMGGHVEVL